jgi:hypothetical protein
MTRAGSTVDLSEASVNSSRNDSVRWCRRSGEGLDDATIPRSAGFGWPINAAPPIIVQTSISLAFAVLAEAALSFLGLGTQPPNPSWGLMLAEGREFIQLAWWLAFFPGMAIVVTVLCFNLLGDGLRDVLDPRQRTLMAGGGR